MLGAVSQGEMVVSCITSTDLIRVLERARKLDDLGTKIAKAMELIEGVLDDLGWVVITIHFLSFHGYRTLPSPTVSVRKPELK